jgi:hypothetical protein
MAISIQGTPLRTGYSTSLSPSTGTIASYTPVAGDIIAVWVRGSVNGTTMTTPSGWVNPLGTNTVVSSATHCECAIYHIVTSAEQTAGTTAWTLSSLWGSTQTGATYTIALRGVNQSSPVDTSGSTSSSTATTTHVLAGITPNFSNSMILSGVTGDGSATYSTAPSGWAFQAQNSGGQNTGALLSRTALSSAGVAVPATNITIGTSSQYASITVAFAVPTTAKTSAFLAFF